MKGAKGRSYEGSGIGLSLVQELVKLHGGFVRVESKQGRGSRFVVTVPLGSAHLPQEHVSARRTLQSTATRAEAFVEEALRWLPEAGEEQARPDTAEREAEGLPLERSSAPAFAGAPERRYRVLVADDNADMRAYLRRLLEDNFDVILAENGAAALKTVREQAPDLVLSDVMMPEIDGFGLLREVRADERTRTLPFIMLSARAGEEARIEGMAAGADDYLVKPFSARELLARVSAHLQISEIRRAAEAAVREQFRRADLLSEQFGTLLNEAPLGVCLIDAGFRIQQANPVARRAFDDVPDLVGRDFGEVTHCYWPGPYADEIVQLVRHTFETGEPYVAQERIHERASRGATAYYEWRISRIPLPDGQQGVVCYFRDVSAQVLARLAIEESAERFRFMAESMPQKIFTARADGDGDYLNRQWMKFTGLTAEQMLGWNWTRLVHPDDLGENIRRWQHSIQTGEPLEYMHRLRRADGVYRWHLTRASAMSGKDKAISMWIGSSTEIHEQKETETALRRANEDLNQFAFAASHDLQEPLRMITSYSQMLLRSYRGQLDEKAELYAGYVAEGTRRMRELLSDLLSYSTAATNSNVSVSVVDLNSVLQMALQNLEASLTESGARVTSDALPSVTGHDAWFLQLFQNLVGNAVKYRSSAPPRVHVSVETAGREHVFTISDNGVGIAAEYHQQVFGIFKRLHGRSIPGTGIGLAICQRVVERLGGRIWVESEPGRGARFRFSLPAAT